VRDRRPLVGPLYLHCIRSYCFSTPGALDQSIPDAVKRLWPSNVVMFSVVAGTRVLASTSLPHLELCYGLTS
jgi:hypothetical protein